MAINYAIKYGAKIAEMFSKSSFVKQNTSGKLDFVGAKTVRITALDVAPLVDYQRAGASRYGELTDVQDSLYEYTMTQDKAFTRAVDKGDESDQAIQNKAAQWLAQELRQVVVPAADKYALGRFIRLGKVVGVTKAPDKTSVVGLFADAMQSFDDDLVPDEGRVAYVPGTVYKLIAQSDEFIKLEKLGEKSVARGEVGELFGFKIIKTPTSYLPVGCYFLAMHKSAGAFPYKLSETRIHKDPLGVSGAVVEGRQYYDAFILGEKANAVYAAVDAGRKQATPAITVTGGTAAIASADAAEIWYTVDGSDPRFSGTRKAYSAAVPVTDGDIVRAVAYGAFTSDLATYAV